MTIDYYAKSLSEKVLPSFNDMSEEAGKAGDEAYSRLTRFADPEQFDEADIAERAHDAEISFYTMAEEVVQGILNMFTIGLYHLFEQQLLRLHRKELLFGSEENTPGLFNIKEAQQRLLRYYKLVANTVRHADGRSCKHGQDLLDLSGEFSRLACTAPEAVTGDGACGRNSRRIKSVFGL